MKHTIIAAEGMEKVDAKLEKVEAANAKAEEDALLEQEDKKNLKQMLPWKV